MSDGILFNGGTTQAVLTKDGQSTSVFVGTPDAAAAKQSVSDAATQAAAAANSAALAGTHEANAATYESQINDLRNSALIRGNLPVGWFDPANYTQAAWYRNDYNVKFFANGLRFFTMMAVSAIGFNSGWLDPANITLTNPSDGLLYQAVDLERVKDPCLQFGVTVVPIHVKPSGSDTTGDGGSANPYRSVPKAITVANAGSAANAYDIQAHVTGQFAGNETWSAATYNINNNTRIRLLNEGGGPGLFCPGMRESYTTALFAFVDLGDGFYQITAANASISTNAKNTPWIYDPSRLDSDGRPIPCQWVSGTYADGPTAKAAIIAAVGSGNPGFNYNATSGLVFRLASGTAPVPGQTFVYNELITTMVLQPSDGTAGSPRLFKVDGAVMANCGRVAAQSNWNIQPQGFALGAGQPNIQHYTITTLSNCGSIGSSQNAVVGKSFWRLILSNFKDYDSWSDFAGSHTLYTYLSVSNDPAQGLYDHLFADRCFSNQNHSGGDGRNPALTPAVDTSANGPTGHERTRFTSINGIYRGSNGSLAGFVSGSHFMSIGNVYSGPKIVTPSDDHFSAIFLATDLDASGTERTAIFSAYDSAYVDGDLQGRTAVFVVGPSGDIAFVGFNGVVSKVLIRSIKLNSNPANGDTVTAGSIVVTFKTAPTGAWDCQIGASNTATAANLAALFNANASLSTDTYAYVSSGDSRTVCVRKLLSSGQDLPMATSNPANITVNASNPTITEMSNFAGPPGPPGPSVANGTYGDITVTAAGNTWTVNNGAISTAKMAGMNDSTIRGRAVGAGFGTPQDLSPAQVTAFIQAFTSTLSGAVPASGGGTSNFLRADGTWSPVGGGSITLTGDVTGSGTGSFATTIANGAVTYAKMQNAAGAGVVGATSAGAMSLLTVTQLTALVNNFTASLSGAVPAPGTSTGKFLRDDATWQAVTATPGGSSGQVQYNNASAMAGAANATIDGDGDLTLGESARAVTPAADKAKLFASPIAAGSGRDLFNIVGADGSKQTLQSMLGRRNLAWCQPFGASTATPTFNGMAALNLVGAGTARTPASTNRATRSRRFGMVSSATAGNIAALYNIGATTLWYTGGAHGAGFLAVFRFVVSDAATVSGALMFVGMRNTQTQPSATTSPDTFTNCVGVAQISGSTTLHIVYGGSSAQTSIDLGANFPANTLSADLYELILYARPDDATKIAYKVTRVDAGDNTDFVASGVLSGTAGTAIPSNSTTPLGPCMFRSNNATALAVGLDLVTLMIESDL